MAMLEVENLSVAFGEGKSRVPICSDVSFTLDSGRVLGLIGESGSGKTVTCKALLDLLPDSVHVAADGLRFEGEELLEMPRSEFDALRGTEIAMIFQDPVGSFNPVKTVGWHFRHAAKRRRGGFSSRREAVEAARDALRRVEIASPEEALAKYPHQLSGGMLQRCLIALTLFCRPRLIVADEPTTNLDNLVERQIIAIFDKLRHELDASFIFITHDMTIAERISDEIAVMYAGQIVEHGATAEIMRNPRHPYTRALIRTARELEGDVELLTEIPGEVASGLARQDMCRFGPRCGLHGPACDAPIPMRLVEGHGRVRCIKAEATTEEEMPA